MKVDQVHASKHLLFTNGIRSRGSFIYGQGLVLEGGFDVAMSEVGESRIESLKLIARPFKIVYSVSSERH